MSFILRDGLIGYFSKSTPRANTILRWKVDIQKVLCMFACILEDFLQGVPESPVHDVIINFAHGGDEATQGKPRTNHYTRDSEEKGNG